MEMSARWPLLLDGDGIAHRYLEQRHAVFVGLQSPDALDRVRRAVSLGELLVLEDRSRATGSANSTTVFGQG